MRVAVVQLNTQDDLARNLERVRHWVAEAARAGAQLVTLPENFAFMGEEAQKRELAERLDGAFPGPILGALTAAAKEAGVWLLGGGMPERSEDLSRPYNTSVLVDPEGEIAATYRKVHLFDVSLADGTTLRESAATSAGSEAITAELLGVRLGLSICYDVRFPELYRRLVDQGARVVTVPAAFTVTTGKDHWLPLLRARAHREPGVRARARAARPAPARPADVRQVGRHRPVGRGHRAVLRGRGRRDRPDAIFAYQDQVRTSLPSLLHRKW